MSVKIIDTHSHIYQDNFDEDIDSVILRAQNVGVDKILLPNIDVESIERVNQLSDRYPNYCIPMMGLHPTSVGENWQEDLTLIKEQFNKRKYIAVGEIGIDLYWDKSLEKEQKLAFEEQLKWSIEYGFPVAIHSREAISQCIESIYNVGAENLRGVFHSFGGNETELENILQLENFYLGINGVVTYKKSTLPTVLQNTDLSRLLIETDSPYLPPVPYRGKRNESSYTIHVVEKLSEIYNVSTADVMCITTNNAIKLFDI